MAAEAGHKGFCDTEMGKAKTTRDFEHEKTMKLSAELEGFEVKKLEREQNAFVCLTACVHASLAPACVLLHVSACSGACALCTWRCPPACEELSTGVCASLDVCICVPVLPLRVVLFIPVTLRAHLHLTHLQFIRI